MKKRTPRRERTPSASLNPKRTDLVSARRECGQVPREQVETPCERVSPRAAFVDHIQRVEAYLNGASLDDVEQDVLPAHLRDEQVAAYAGALFDETQAEMRGARRRSPQSPPDDDTVH